MGWPVNSSNSKQFTIAGEKYALAMVRNVDLDDLYWLAVCKWNGSEWLNIGLVERSVTNETIMAAGHVAEYILSRLALANQVLAEALKPQKPDIADKGACVGYDLAFPGCVAWDPETQTFVLTMTPPLPHARP